MFLRVVRAASAKCVKHEYLRLVESYREDGKSAGCPLRAPERVAGAR